MEASPQVSWDVDAQQPALAQVWELAERLSEEQVSAAIQRYRAGTSAKAIAQSLGISKSALLDLLRSEGVPVRPHCLLSDDDVNTAAQLYESGLLLREVAAQLGVSTEAIRKRLVAAGVKMRVGIGGRAGGPRRR